TDAFGTRFAIAHHTSRGRYNGNTQSAEYFRQLFLTAEDPQAGFADTLNAFDNRRALEIPEFDGQRSAGALALVRELADVTLVLQHPGQSNLRFRTRHCDAGLASVLTVTNTSQHVRDRISHTHFLSPPTNLPWSGQ